MLAITLGFKEHGRTAHPVSLYAGNDAGLAEEIFTNPPAGIVRTQLFKNPQPTRRREIPNAIPVFAVEEPAEAKRKAVPPK